MPFCLEQDLLGITILYTLYEDHVYLLKLARITVADILVNPDLSLEC